MVQLAAGRGGAARHAAGGQAGVLHTAVRAAPSGAAAHSSTATTLATASATAGPTPGPTAAGLAAAGLAAGWLAAAGLAAAGATGPTGTAGESTEAGVAAGHGVRGWVSCRSFGGDFYVKPFIYPGQLLFIQFLTYLRVFV